MENTYNGAVMALPNREEELFAQINEKTAGRRMAMQAEADRANREMYLYSDAEPEEVRARPDLGRAAGVMARLLAGCVFLGAAVRGWCGMEFGIACAAVCGIWALMRWRRK